MGAQSVREILIGRRQRRELIATLDDSEARERELLALQPKQTAAFLALVVARRHGEVRQILQAVPVLVAATDPRGNTALHLAVRANDAEMVATLLEHGASILDLNAALSTPMDMAHVARNTEVVGLLACVVSGFPLPASVRLS